MDDLENINLQTEKYIINKYMSMPKLFDSLDIPYNENTTMYCPFHPNQNTKAAKLYYDEVGWRLWCFSESRMYSAYDIYKIFKREIDTHQLAISILKQFSEKDRIQIIKDSGQEIELSNISFKSDLEKFKRHSIKYDELITHIVNQLKKGES